MSHYDKGKNYLYDSFDEEELKDFTEADLKTAEKHRGGDPDSDLKVRSTPTRVGAKSKNPNEHLNPYMNPYLDSDLSTTIGKMKGTRK